MVSGTIRLERAGRLRRDATDAERRLRLLLRNRGRGGAKFRRQVPVGPFIADFLCHEAKLIIEADGGQHSESLSDAARDTFLKAQGYRLLHIWNNDIVDNLDGVATTILVALDTPHPPAAVRRVPPSPHGGEGIAGAVN